MSEVCAIQAVLLQRDQEEIFGQTSSIGPSGPIGLIGPSGPSGPSGSSGSSGSMAPVVRVGQMQQIKFGSVVLRVRLPQETT